MFGAFSSIDYHSIWARTPAETAVKRLNGIGEVLSELAISDMRTSDEVARALQKLDTAEKCVRLVLTEFRSELTPEIVRKASSITDLIERARDEISACRNGGGISRPAAGLNA